MRWHEKWIFGPLVIIACLIPCALTAWVIWLVLNFAITGQR